MNIFDYLSSTIIILASINFPLMPFCWQRLRFIKNKAHKNFYMIAVQIQICLFNMNVSIFIIGIICYFIEYDTKSDALQLKIFNFFNTLTITFSSSMYAFFILIFCERLIATKYATVYEHSETCIISKIGGIACWGYGIINGYAWYFSKFVFYSFCS